MVKSVYRLHRRKMYLDSKVYYKAVEMNINWDEIDNELKRLQKLGHPSPTYNTAAIMAIDKRCQETMNKGLGAINSTHHGFGMGKKGFVLDNLTLMVSLMVMISLLVLSAAYIESQNESIQDSSSDAIFKSTFNTSVGGFNQAADIGLVAGIVILVVFLLYASYSIGTNPGLFILALLMNVITLFVLPILEDFLIDSFYNNDYASAAASMPGTFYIINNYAIFITGITVLMFIALWIRPSGGTQ